MTITVQRKTKTDDGIFGALSLDWNQFTCFTVENKSSAIPAGIYDMTFDYSNRFNRIMPHIWVPSRDQAAKERGDDNAGIRLHWGNFPSNYEGCIGVGNGLGTDSIDNTVATFNQLYAILNMQAGLKIQVLDIPA